ncbi:MAG TPA: hypothetical protein VF256_14130 [Streptosporangiaceae bacterium]
MAMTDHPPQPAEIAALIHDAGERWQIEHDTGLDVWTAVRRSPDGRHIRVLVARDPAGLRGKLETVGPDEHGPGNAPGVAMPGGGWISGPCT